MQGPSPIEVTDWCRWLAVFGQNETCFIFSVPPVQKTSAPLATHIKRDESNIFSKP